MTKIILGAVLTYLAFQGKNSYAAILFVEGIILINWGIMTWGSRRH